MLKNFKSRRIILVVGLMAVALLGTAAAAAQTDEPPHREDGIARPGTPTTVSFAARPVSAEQLWHESLRTADCFEEAGMDFLGPWPTDDGTAVRYAVTAERYLAEVDATCAWTWEGMSARFAVDASPEQARALGDRREALEICLVDRGVADRSLRDSTGRAADEVMGALAQADSPGFVACVRSAG